IAHNVRHHRIDNYVVYGDGRKFLRYFLARLDEQAIGDLQHIGLVYNGDTLAPAHCQLECGARDALAASASNASEPDCNVFCYHSLTAPRFHVAVGIESFGIFAGDDQVEFSAPQRKAGVGPGGADIREQIKTLSQHHRGIDLAARGILELKCGRRAEHHPFGTTRLLDDVEVNCAAMSAQAGVTDRRLLNIQMQVKAVGHHAQYSERSGRDFRADAITRKDKKLHEINSRRAGPTSSPIPSQRKGPPTGGPSICAASFTRPPAMPGRLPRA